MTADAQENNEIDEIFDGMVNNLNVPKFAIRKGKDVVKKIAKFVKDADRKISQIYAEIARQTQGQIQMSRQMRIDFSKVKSNLRQSRTGKFFSKVKLSIVISTTFELSHQKVNLNVLKMAHFKGSQI